MSFYTIFTLFIFFCCPYSAQAEWPDGFAIVYNEQKFVDLILFEERPTTDYLGVLLRNNQEVFNFRTETVDPYFTDFVSPNTNYTYVVEYYRKNEENNWELVAEEERQVHTDYCNGTLYNGPNRPFDGRPPVKWEGDILVDNVLLVEGSLKIHQNSTVLIKDRLEANGEKDNAWIFADGVTFKNHGNSEGGLVVLRDQYPSNQNAPFKGCTFETGLSIEGTTAEGIKKIVLAGNTFYSLYLNAHDSTIENNHFTSLIISGSNNFIFNNQISYLSIQSDNTLQNNVISGGSTIRGLSNELYENRFTGPSAKLSITYDARENILRKNVFEGNTLSLHVKGTKNIIVDNFFGRTANDDNAAVDDGQDNVWNEAKTSGVNVVGGPFLGGNYWFNDANRDADGDGIGDKPFAIPGSADAFDKLPLVSNGLLLREGGANPDNRLIIPAGDPFIVSHIELYNDGSVEEVYQINSLTFNSVGDPSRRKYLWRVYLYKSADPGLNNLEHLAENAILDEDVTFVIDEKVAAGESIFFVLKYEFSYTKWYENKLSNPSYYASEKTIEECHPWTFGASIDPLGVGALHADVYGPTVTGTVEPVHHFIAVPKATVLPIRGKIGEPETAQILATWNGYEDICVGQNYHPVYEVGTGERKAYIGADPGFFAVNYISLYANQPMFDYLDCGDRSEEAKSRPVAEVYDIYIDDDGYLHWAQGNFVENPYQNPCVPLDGAIEFHVTDHDSTFERWMSDIVKPLKEWYGDENVIQKDFKKIDGVCYGWVDVFSTERAEAVLDHILKGTPSELEQKGRRIDATYHTAYAKISHDIKANGSDGAIITSSSQPVSVTISLNPGNEEGVMAEWWLTAETPSGSWSYIHHQGWQSGHLPSFQAPLFKIESFPVWKDRLTPGEYTFSFTVDKSVDGIQEKMWTDSVSVTVIPRVR